MDYTLQESIMLAAMEGNLPNLLALGRDCLGRPLLLGGETLNVLGWSGPPSMPGDAAWEDFIREGLAPAFHWSDDLFKANSMDLSFGFTVCQMSQPDGLSHWVVDIEMPGAQPLHLILPDRDTPGLPPPDLHLLGLVCLAIRSCVNNRSHVEPYQPFSVEQLLLQLIRIEKIDEPLLRFRAQCVHLESEGFFSLLMLDLQGYHPQRNSVATIRAQLSAVLGSRSVIDGELLTFLVSHPSDEETVFLPLWKKVEDILTANGLYGVFSERFYRLGEFHSHYTRTLNSLKLRFCAESDQHLIPSGSLALYSLIANLRELDSAATPVPPPLRILLHSDRTRKTCYVETLTAFLRHSQKPLPTCDALHIHRNTLDYRLRRIEELTGLDWGDGDLMFKIYLSLCIMRYDQLAGTHPELQSLSSAPSGRPL